MPCCITTADLPDLRFSQVNSPKFEFDTVYENPDAMLINLFSYNMASGSAASSCEYDKGIINKFFTFRVQGL